MKFYGFREFPFALASEPGFFFKSEAHREALASMLYVIQQQKGMLLVTGEIGAGKTFLAHVLQEKLKRQSICVYLQDPPESTRQLYRNLAQRLGFKVPEQAEKSDIMDLLREFLTAQSARKRLVTLIIDEAQDLKAALLGEIRRLWNWEVNGRHLLQIALIGQGQLRKLLREPEWEALRQRIALSYHLGRLTEKEMAAYIEHRLHKAALSKPRVAFEETALELIYRATKGTPRLINSLCDNALLIGYAKEINLITGPIIIEAIKEMSCLSLPEGNALLTGRP